MQNNAQNSRPTLEGKYGFFTSNKLAKKINGAVASGVSESQNLTKTNGDSDL